MEWHAPPDDLNLSNPLWKMALELWSDSGFAEACLEAQSQGFAVSHILVALYSALTGLLWDGHEPSDLGEWRRQATERLRALRRGLAKENPAVAALRQQLQESELAAEQVELAWWWHYLGGRDSWSEQNDLSPAERARHNLGAIGLDSDPACIRSRIIDCWNQASKQHAPTGNPK